MPCNGLAARKQRLARRSQWLNDGFSATTSCDIVFLDPDNGLEVKSVKPHQKKGPKYVYFDELTPFLRRGQSIVIYQHLCRNGSALEQVEYRLAQIRELFTENPRPWAVLYRRGTVRAFLIIPNRIHKDILLKRTKSFLNTAWAEHFDKNEIY